MIAVGAKSRNPMESRMSSSENKDSLGRGIGRRSGIWMKKREAMMAPPSGRLM